MTLGEFAPIFIRSPRERKPWCFTRASFRQKLGKIDPPCHFERPQPSAANVEHDTRPGRHAEYKGFSGVCHSERSEQSRCFAFNEMRDASLRSA
jgi:hypothetical protein